MDDSGIVGLNFDHLASGCSEPARLTTGTMRIYGMRFCPYVERVLIALLIKKIPFEVININLQDKPEWYFMINPLGKVPTLEYDGQIIYESLVCVDYLDEAFSTGQKLLPIDLYERAKQRMLVERLSGLASALYQWYRSPLDRSSTDQLISVINLYENLLKDKYFAGVNPGYVDYMCWPWVERLSSIPTLSNGQLKIEAEKYPKLIAYKERMETIPEISKVLLDGQTHARFTKSRLEGKVNYDI